MPSRSSHHAAFVALFILYLGIVTYLCFGHPSSYVRIPVSLWGLPFDKCVHFIMFFPYPFLAQEAFYRKNKWRSMVLVILTGLILCFALEMLQDKLTTHRTTDPWDLAVNVASITIASFITSFINLFRK